MTSEGHDRSASFLLSQIGAHAARRFAEQLEPIGLTPRAYAVLSNLHVLGPRTQQRVADELGMHRNNMVSLIDDLEASGWVRRVRNPDDRRSYSLRLTPSGRRRTRAALRVVSRLDEELVAGLGADERVRLLGVLTEVADRAGLTPGVHPHLSRRRTP